jgi:hypothetical protein
LRPAFDFLFFGKGLTGFGLLIGTLYSSPTLFALIGCKRSRIIADYLGLTIETVSRTLTSLESCAAIEVPSSRHIVLRNRSALNRMNG